MSVSALDQLLLSIAGRPPLVGVAAKTRDARVPYDTLVPFQSRYASESHSKPPRKRQHATATPRPQPSLSLRLYGLKKNGWPRTLLAALRVDVDELDAPRTVGLRRPSASPTRELASDSKVRLFFDGLVLQATGLRPTSRLAWRPPSSLVTQTTTSRPRLHVDIGDAVIHPSVEIPIDREIDLVRSRRKSPRRMSLASKRSRRCSSSEPQAGGNRKRHATVEDDDRQQLELLTDDAIVELDRVEAAIDAATSSAMRIVAAEANAQLSFELMERKASHNTHYGATTAWWGEATRAHSVELPPSHDGGVSEAVTPVLSPREELATLRAENAEQKALIRQLLIENRRLLAQHQQPQQQQQQQTLSWENTSSSSPPTSKRKRWSDSSQERYRGVSSASTVSSSSSPWSRRDSLTFSVVDGLETFVDHKFDHLVSEITSEIAELFSDDDGFY